MAEMNKKPGMNWTEEKDVMLLKEMGGQGIFHYKAGSRERGAVWQVIASNLNCHKDLFDVTARGVRDRFTLLSRRYKSKTSRELKGSGTGGDELTEFELLMEDMIALSEESDKKAASARANANADRQKALEIRKKAMETMGESKKRQADADDEVKEKKKRRSGGDTMSWLREKTEIDAKLKEKELEEQKQEKEIERKERNEQMGLLRQQLQMQIDSQQQQQQQQNIMQQQMMALMQQQQQQLQLMFTNVHRGDK
ncbi:uncharacterized protein LOC144665364 [Oculina patagonica]